MTGDEAKRLAETFTRHFDWSVGSDQEFTITTNAVEGLSESNRMAFYRVITVRNQLMSLTGLQASKIRQRILPVSINLSTGLEGLEVRISKSE